MFNAIVLAADRGPDDPVAVAAGVAAKCLTPVAGRPMVVRVAHALEQSARVQTILLCGPAAEALAGSPELRRMVSDGAVRWMDPAATPSASAALALAALPEEEPVLLTTGDHPLLESGHGAAFSRPGERERVRCRRGVGAVRTGAQNLPSHATDGAEVQQRALLRLQSVRVSLTPRPQRWRSYGKRWRTSARHPIRVIGLIGWGAMALYALGMLSLASAVARLSRRTGVKAHVVTMPFAEAAIDVDSVADLDLVRAIVARTG